MAESRKDRVRRQKLLQKKNALKKTQDDQVKTRPMRPIIRPENLIKRNLKTLLRMEGEFNRRQILKDEASKKNIQEVISGIRAGIPGCNNEQPETGADTGELSSSG